MKTIIKGIIIGVIVVAGIFLMFRFDVFPGFKKKNLKIDDTANVIEEIKRIGEFTSLCYYEEMALVESKGNDFNQSKLASLTNTEIIDELVIIAHGKVRAGFDLTKLEEGDIQVTGDTLSIRLPEAEIFDVILNPSDYEIFVENGKWSHEQFSALQKQASANLKSNAEKYGIVEKAKETGIKKLDGFFKTFGFSKIFFL